MPRFHPGSPIGKYPVGGLVGAGGCSGVYEARDPKGARCALKIFEGDEAVDSTPQARFAFEGEATAMIEHVNVLRFRDIGVHEGARVFIVFDFIDGGRLRDVLDKAGGKLPVEDALRWLRQAAEG